MRCSPQARAFRPPFPHLSHLLAHTPQAVQQPGGPCTAHTYISFFEVHSAGVGCVLDIRHAQAAAPREPHLTGSREPLLCDVLPGHLAPPSAAMGLANLKALTLCFSEPSSLMSTSRSQNYTSPASGSHAYSRYSPLSHATCSALPRIQRCCLSCTASIT